MAKPKTKKPAAKSPEASKKKTAATAAKSVATTKTKMSDEEKQAKKAARLEAMRNRPAVQRPNSKQIDVMELENGGKVINYAYAIRKVGTIITSVALDAEGNVVGTSVTTLSGTKVKVKKGHGTIVPGLAGDSRSKSSSKEDDDEEDEDEEDED